MSNKTSDNSVAKIEDDIKLVKRYLENSAYKETDSDFFKNGGWEMVDLEIPKQVVIDTMEELKTKRRKLGFKTYLRREDMLNEDKMIVCKIEVLQKLLDGEK